MEPIGAVITGTCSIVAAVAAAYVTTTRHRDWTDDVKKLLDLKDELQVQTWDQKADDAVNAESVIHDLNQRILRLTHQRLRGSWLQQAEKDEQLVLTGIPFLVGGSTSLLVYNLVRQYMENGFVVGSLWLLSFGLFFIVAGYALHFIRQHKSQAQLGQGRQ